MISCLQSQGNAHALQVVGVLVLLAAGQADGETLKQGVVGDSHIKPYNIVIIFMSQARASGGPTQLRSPSPCQRRLAIRMLCSSSTGPKSLRTWSRQRQCASRHGNRAGPQDASGCHLGRIKLTAVALALPIGDRFHSLKQVTVAAVSELLETDICARRLTCACLWTTRASSLTSPRKSRAAPAGTTDAWWGSHHTASVGLA